MQYSKKEERVKVLHNQDKWAKVKSAGKFVVVYKDKTSQGQWIDSDDFTTVYKSGELSFV